jgi:surface carbohydrate biosynthesis protein (TIGR04326 family)
MTNCLIVWDYDSPPPPSDSRIFLWRGTCGPVTAGTVSAAALIEADANRLRTRFVKWAEGLAESQSRGTCLRQLLMFDQQLSLWWSSPMAIKCEIEKSAWITDILKLVCFRDWITSDDGLHVTKVVYHGSSGDIAKCIATVCAHRDIDFRWTTTSHSGLWDRRTLARLTSKLPRILKGALWIGRFFAQRIGLGRADALKWANAEGSACFVDYLLHVPRDRSSNGCGESAYWSSLPDDLRARGVRTNWLHVLIPRIDGYSARDARRILRDLNSANGGIETHCCVDSFITLPMTFAVLAQYISFCIRNLHYRAPASLAPLDGVDVWPLAREQWLDGLFGTPLAASLMYTHLFAQALGTIKHQRIGVYLQEGAAWEYPMIAAWRNTAHGLLVGSPHSTIRFWDLRITGSASGGTGSVLDRPQPDLIAVNGPTSRRLLATAGHSQERLVDVEALRYRNLLSVADRPCSGSGALPKLLVVTEYSSRVTTAQLACLRDALALIACGWEIRVKSHIACPIPPSTLRGLGMCEVFGSVVELARDSDAVFVGPMTSAVVDCLASGTPMAVFRDPAELDWSPIRGVPGIIRVCSPVELASFLLNPVTLSDGPSPSDVFYLSSQSTRWQRLILGTLLTNPEQDALKHETHL